MPFRTTASEVIQTIYRASEVIQTIVVVHVRQHNQSLYDNISTAAFIGKYLVEKSCWVFKVQQICLADAMSRHRTCVMCSTFPKRENPSFLNRARGIGTCNL